MLAPGRRTFKGRLLLSKIIAGLPGAPATFDPITCAAAAAGSSCAPAYLRPVLDIPDTPLAEVRRQQDGNGLDAALRLSRRPTFEGLSRPR